MTGEMSKSDLADYPTHKAVADALGGVLRPFDKYQGPYISTPYGRLWLQDDEPGAPRVVLTEQGTRPRTRKSASYSDRDTIAAARALIRDVRRSAKARA